MLIWSSSIELIEWIYHETSSIIYTFYLHTLCGIASTLTFIYLNLCNIRVWSQILDSSKSTCKEMFILYHAELILEYILYLKCWITLFNTVTV